MGIDRWSCWHCGGSGVAFGVWAEGVIVVFVDTFLVVARIGRFFSFFFYLKIA